MLGGEKKLYGFAPKILTLIVHVSKTLQIYSTVYRTGKWILWETYNYIIPNKN